MRKIIVAPLNWGLGHATRCIPIIKSLQQAGFTPILASDGAALNLLQKEFPELKSYTLPSYDISYAKNPKFSKTKLLLKLPKLLDAVKREKQVVAKIVVNEKIAGIISDNRFGVWSGKIPSVYITHQIQVLSGNTTFLTSRIHQNVIKKFTECWIPDFDGTTNLAGKLAHLPKTNLNVKYIGPLSRFTFAKRTKKWDILVVLSGPEPQRSFLEEKLLKQLKGCSKSILLVRGLIENFQKWETKENFTIVNFLLQEELQDAINASSLLIARSGYSTIMDFHALQPKVLFIPTPGQYEQEYLARYLEENKIAPFVEEHIFTVNDLERITNYKGFGIKKTVKPKTHAFDFTVFQS